MANNKDLDSDFKILSEELLDKTPDERMKEVLQMSPDEQLAL